MRRLILPTLLAMTGITPHLAAAQPVTNPRTQWFTDARLGGFIHWSAGGVLGARWFGEPLRNPTPYGEWARHRNRVPRADYDAAIAHMSVTPEQVDHWVKNFKDAGCSYVIFVAKHHDGLAFWPSDVSTYTFANLSKCQIDVCAEMRKACDRHGMKLAFYYSQWQDWEHPDGWGNFWDHPQKPSPNEWKHWYDLQYTGTSASPGLTPQRFDHYWNEKCMPQVAELLDRYHPDIMWFDCYIPPAKSNMTEAKVARMLKMIRQKAPNCLVNSRLGLSTIGGDAGADFETLGDNEFSDKLLDHPWETAATLNRSWGYNRDDDQWKSPGFFLKMAAQNISHGGNLTINVGPKPDGSLPEDAITIFQGLARTIPTQLSAFRGCGPSGLDSRAQDWGTAVSSGNHLFLHVFEWPIDGIIRVTGLESHVTSAKILVSGKNLSTTKYGSSLHINVPPTTPLPWDTVIDLTIDGPTKTISGLTGEINGGGWHLGQATATLKQTTRNQGDQFWLPAHITGFTQKGSSACWKINIPSAGNYQLKICQACPEKNAAGSLDVLLDETLTTTFSVRGTAPDATEFRTFDAKTLTVETPGIHTITLRSDGKAGPNLRVAWMHLSQTN